MTTTSKITDVFPHKTLVKCSSPPTLHEVLKLKKQVYANASNVKSVIGHATHGHIGQVMPEEQYLQLPGIIEPWVDPPQPARWPPERRIPTADYQREHTEHQEAKNIFEKCAQLNSALIACMVEAINEDDISDLRCSMTGAYNTTAKAILEHLTTNYSYITEAQLQTEAGKIRSIQYDPDNMNVGEVITKLEELQNLATAAGRDYSRQQLVHMGVDVFRRCGHFARACTDWRAVPAANQTLSELRTHFTRHQLYLLENNPEGVGARYGTQLANLAQMTESTIQDITNNVGARLERLKTLYVAAMEERENNSKTEKVNAVTSNSGSGTSNTKNKNNNTKKKKNDFGEQAGNTGNPNKYYCFVHGSQNSHPSAHCKAKKRYDNFCEDATFEDKKGGCALIARSS